MRSFATPFAADLRIQTFPIQGAPARAFRDWLLTQAEQARSNDDLARRFIVRCRDTMTILPAITTIERLCADVLVAAERNMEKRIATRLDRVACTRLDRLTTEMLPGAISRFIWLRRIEPGNNSAAANRLLDRLEFLRAMNLGADLLAGVPPQPWSFLLAGACWPGSTWPKASDCCIIPMPRRAGCAPCAP